MRFWRRSREAQTLGSRRESPRRTSKITARQTAIVSQRLFAGSVDFRSVGSDPIARSETQVRSTNNYKISSAFSGGRPITALVLAPTIGRSIRIGCATMAAIKAASSRAASSNPYAMYSASFFLMRARAPMPSIDNIRASSVLVGGVFKYSIISGSMPWSARSAKVWRDLLHRGL